MRNKIKKLILFLGDLAVLYLSLYFSLFLRYGPDFNLRIWENHYPTFSLVFIVWILVFYITGLYNLFFSQNNKLFFRATLKSLGISGIIAALFFYLNPNIDIAPKTNLLLFLAVFIFIFVAWRMLYNKILSSYLPKNKIAYIGFNSQTKEIIGFIEKNPNIGYRSSLIVDLNSLVDKEEYSIKIINTIENLKEVLRKKQINTIVFASGSENSNELRQKLFSSISLRLQFFNSTSFYEMVVGKIPINAINQMWFLENLNEGNKILFDKIKRFFDLLLGLIIFLLTAPFWLLVGLIIKLESQGPVFFKQTRLGQAGQEFEIIKFRTMRTDNNDFAPTKKNDTRITKFGSFLRKSRIDEIPQVINIIKGEMSFVGPRPERPDLVEKLERVVPFYKERMLVRPGLTGWDQVSGEYHSPSEEDTLKKLQYDLFYIKNRSSYLDLSILLKTVAVVFSRSGM